MQKIPNLLLLANRDDQLAYFILLAPNRLIVFKVCDLCIGGVNISHHKVEYNMKFMVRIISRFRKLHLKKMLVDFRVFEYVESVNLKKQKWRWCNEKEFQFFNVTYNQEPRFTSTKPWILHSMYIMSCGKSLLQFWFQIIKCICAPYVCDFGFLERHWINLISNKQQYFNSHFWVSSSPHFNFSHLLFLGIL